MSLATLAPLALSLWQLLAAAGVPLAAAQSLGALEVRQVVAEVMAVEPNMVEVAPKPPLV